MIKACKRKKNVGNVICKMIANNCIKICRKKKNPKPKPSTNNCKNKCMVKACKRQKNKRKCYKRVANNCKKSCVKKKKSKTMSQLEYSIEVVNWE